MDLEPSDFSLKFMASKETLALNDTDEAAIDRYAVMHGLTRNEQLYQHLQDTLVKAHLDALKAEKIAAIAQKVSTVSDDAKRAALDAQLKQIEVTKAAEILDAQEAAADAALDSGKDIEVKL